MPSEIEICNLSLSRIGQGSINSLTEYSPQAQVCNLLYTNCRDALLREFPWNFATKNVLLSEVTQTIPGWDYVYQYPPQALWVRKIFNEGSADREIPYEYEVVSTGTEKFICCDVYQAYAKCTIKIKDPSLFDPLFVEALSYKLASELTMPLTNSSSKTQEVLTKYQLAMANARLAGAVEGSAKKPEGHKPQSVRSYITARR